MVSFLAFLGISLDQILRKWLYAGMLLLLVMAGLGVPLPEDVPLLLAGCLCRAGYGTVAYVILVGLVGVLAGDITLYTVGRRFGLGVLEMRPFRRLITRAHIAQMKLLFRRRGNVIIFFGRFFVGVRSVMCVTAGICRVPSWKFILIDISGALVTVPILVGLGWFFSDKIVQFYKSGGLARIQHLIGGLAAALLVAWVIYIHLTKTRSKVIRKQLQEHGETEGKTDGHQQ